MGDIVAVLVGHIDYEQAGNLNSEYKQFLSFPVFPSYWIDDSLIKSRTETDFGLRYRRDYSFLNAFWAYYYSLRG